MTQSTFIRQSTVIWIWLSFCLCVLLHKKNIFYTNRSGDPHIEDGYFLHVNLRNEHNHKLASPEVMRWRDVSNETIEKLHELFKSGHSPSSALKIIKYNLQEEEGENYIYAIADRSICPDLQFCYRSVESTHGDGVYTLYFFSNKPITGMTDMKKFVWL